MSNMKTKEDILVGAAKNWWKKKRPQGWTIRKHLDNPFINTKNESEKQLAGAIAAVVLLDQSPINKFTRRNHEHLIRSKS